jgi:2-methylcitrate dehydratase PrpD
MMSSSYSKKLAEYLSGLDYDDLPKDIVKKAKHLILDYLGYTVSAVDEPHAKILLSVVKSLGGREESTILGFGQKTSCLYASLLNGAMGHMCELDDTHQATFSHPGNPIISSGLALAEREKVSGKDFITAIVAAYEATLRIGESISPSHYEMGWCEPWLVFGSASAAGKILRLNPSEMENALNLAGIQGAGVTGWYLESHEYPIMAKDFRPGYLSANGVLAALLAKRGFTSHARFVDNFGKLYSTESYQSKITEDLGKKYRIMEVAHKPYSACRFTHAAIDAMLQLNMKNVLQPSQIRSLKVIGDKHIVGLSKPEPANSLQSRFSVQFQVALTLVEGKNGLIKVLKDPSGYPLKKINDPVIRNIMRKTEVIHAEELDNSKSVWSTIVEIKMQGGEMLIERVDYPKGEPENPFTTEELQDKFKLVTSKVLNEGEAKDFISKIAVLENIRSLSELSSELTYTNK